MNKYDVVIAYRIYPGISKIPPIYADNKLKLSEHCLKSFINSLDGVNYKFIAIVDGCPPEFQEIFTRIIPAERLEMLVFNPKLGNHGTFAKQIEVLLAQNDSELVYFAEDDYVYLPHSFKELVTFMSKNPNADFCTPYDHLDYYNSEFHKYKTTVALSPNHHWRTGASTTLTFLTRKSVLQQAKDILLSYSKGNLDVSVWIALTRYKVFGFLKIPYYLIFKRWMWGAFWRAWRYGWTNILFGKSYSLWVSIPSLATHMESNFIAPSVDWAPYFKSESN